MKLYKIDSVCSKMTEYNRDNWLVYTHVLTGNIVIGSLVKISNGRERFYVEVVRIDSVDIVGRVCNKLVKTDAYNMDDLVVFHTANAFEIMSPQEKTDRANTAKPILLASMKAFARYFMMQNGRMPTRKEGEDYFESINTRIV